MEFKEEGAFWYNSICTNRIKEFMNSISIYWSPLFSLLFTFSPDPGLCPAMYKHILNCLPFSKLPFNPVISCATLLPSFPTQTWKINLISVSNFSHPLCLSDSAIWFPTVLFHLNFQKVHQWTANCQTQCNLFGLCFTGHFCCINTVHMHCFSKLFSPDNLDNNLLWLSNHVSAYFETSFSY